jgi:hypothetical protein
MGRKVWYPAVSGPLSAYAAGYVAWLRARSYSPSAISDRLWQFDQLSRWLDREGLPVVELTLAQCLRFAASRRAAGVVTLWPGHDAAIRDAGARLPHCACTARSGGGSAR